MQGVSALVQTLLAPTARCAPLQVSHVLKKGQTTPAGVELPVAEPGTESQYYFYDKVHPSGGVGTGVIAPSITSWFCPVGVARMLRTLCLCG